MNTIIINTAAECTVKKFMDCCFGKKYKVLLVEGLATEEELSKAFEDIYAEYVDIANLWQTREFELHAYIHSLDNRANTIKLSIDLQEKFIKHFSMPFLPGFDLFKRYNHILTWNTEFPNLDVFLKKLNQVRIKEARYETEKGVKIKELLALQEKKSKKEHTLLESRKEFITMMNRLQQQKYVIDKEKTTVEELALMITERSDEVETEKMNNQPKK